MLRLRLNNVDKAFSPEFAGNPLTTLLAPHRPVLDNVAAICKSAPVLHPNLARFGDAPCRFRQHIPLELVCVLFIASHVPLLILRLTDISFVRQLG